MPKNKNRPGKFGTKEYLSSKKVEDSKSFSCVDISGDLVLNETIEEFNERLKENSLLLDSFEDEIGVEEKMENILRRFPVPVYWKYRIRTEK